MDELAPSTKIDLNFSESKVVFGIASCCTDKEYSFWKLDRQEAERLIERLGHIEKMTWRQFASLPRNTGLTSEVSDTNNFRMIQERDRSEQRVVGAYYYFHFRIGAENSTFRVFGYQSSSVFYITHIDPKGKIDRHC